MKDNHLTSVLSVWFKPSSRRQVYREVGFVEILYEILPILLFVENEEGEMGREEE